MFKKYSSIENHYQKKHVQFFLDMFPELQNETYILREKLDGTNLQLFFQPNQKMLVGKRSEFLTEGAGFFDVWNVLAGYQAELSALQACSDQSGKTMRVYGELFGPGINKRIDYGPTKQIRFFDIYIDDMLLSQVQFDSFLGANHLFHMAAPVYAMASNLDEALLKSEEFTSKILNKEGEIAEGFVMQPYSTIYRTPAGERFILKKKAEKFLERNEPKEPKPQKPGLDDRIIKLVEEFKGYINENRVLSVFSKQGPIENISQLGTYIRLVMADAKEDFIKDHPDLTLDKETAKIVFNAGDAIVRLLKGHL